MTEAEIIALRLASAGLYGGDPANVMRARADWVLKAMQYEAFKGDYEDAFVEMNRVEE